MSSTIDYGTLAIGALIGVGCQEQLKSAAKVAASLAANLALATAEAVDTAAVEINKQVNKPAQNGQNGQG